MQFCHLCVNIGGTRPPEFPDDALDEIGGHVKKHQYQNNEMGLEATKAYFAWCFPDSNLDIEALEENESAADQSISRNSSNSAGYSYNGSIEAYCQQLIQKCPQEYMDCTMCDAKLRTAHHFTLVNHAFIHLEKPMFQCMYCSYQGNTPTAMRNHLQKHHPGIPFRAQNYIDNSGQYREEILAMLDRCYPSGQRSVVLKSIKSEPISDFRPIKEEASDDTQVRSQIPQLGFKVIKQEKLEGARHPLSTRPSLYCLNKLKPRSKDGRLWCYPCKAMINVSNGAMSFCSRLALDHAAIHHLKKPLYECRICQQTTPGLCSVINHINAHHHEGAKGNYIDQSIIYEGEIINTLATCYEPKKVSGKKSVVKRQKQKFGGPKSPISTIPSTVDNSLITNMFQRCRDILKENVSDGKAFCKKCDKTISLKSDRGKMINSRSAIDHVLGAHLKVKTYRCKICSQSSSWRTSMSRHLKNNHNVAPPTGSFDDRSYKYEARIVDMIQKCYGIKSQPKPVAEDPGEGPSTSGEHNNGYIQLDVTPVMWKCKYCPAVSKYIKLIKNHLYNRHSKLVFPH